MRATEIMLCVAAFAAGRVDAADRIEQGPAPSWVKPVALPPVPKEDEQPVRVLLFDQQVRLEHGRITRYSETAMRIQTPQGLAIGNISLPWRSDTDRLTVNKLVIRRGDQVIDVLKSGQTFTVVRREPNLEMAMLDNVLTANIQPEGLQVGDVIDIATTLVAEDPTLKDHAEQTVATWNAPVVRAHARVEWPNGVAIRVKQVGALPAARPVRKGDTTSVEWAIDDVVPMVRPKLAPPRFLIGRIAELSDYPDWNTVARLMTPLYDKAATLKPDSALLAEIARIRAASPDPAARAEAALALVEDRVRYVALLAGTGGLVPADADVTWGRRFGDCKGKTALLLALLRGLGIAADAVLVNTGAGDLLGDRLPAAGLFDHVIVRATIAGRTVWLDGTRTGDTKLDRLRPPFYRWGLSLTMATTALAAIVPPPLDRPSEATTVRIDARDGLTVPAPMHAEIVYRDDAALGVKLGMAQLIGEQRDRSLKDFWKEKFDFFQPATVSATFDPATGEEKVVADGVANMDWKQGWFRIDEVGLGWAADLKREPGPDSDAPYAVPYPLYSTIRQTILLPPGFADWTGPGANDVDETVAGIAYKRVSSLKDGIYTIEKSERTTAPEYPYAQAAAAEPRLRELANTTVALRVPAGYRQTAKEEAALLDRTPTTARDFAARAAVLAQRSRIDEALTAADRALALDPKLVPAMQVRALALWTKGDLPGARKQMEAASTLDPENAQLIGLRGMLLGATGDAAQAVSLLTASLAKNPRDADALRYRGLFYAATGEYAKGLADLEAALAIGPQPPEVYLAKANLLRLTGRASEVGDVAKALTVANPGNAYAHVGAASILDAAGDRTGMMREFNAALAIKPEAYIYLNRAAHRTKQEAALALADYEAALKLEPKSVTGIIGKADMLSLQGKTALALTTLEPVEALIATPTRGAPTQTTFAGFVTDDQQLEKDRIGLLTVRIFVHARARAAQALAVDVDRLIALKPATMALNNVCYDLAKQKLALDQALRLCEAAIARDPQAAAILDSRGYVKLLLGRNEDAIADFDSALAKAPGMAASLYGRAIAEARRGDAARSKADAEAADKADPRIRERFAGYGTTL